MEQIHRDAASARLLEAVEQLSPEELDRFAGAVLSLRARQSASSLTVGESELFECINDALPEEARMRLTLLRERRDDEALTEEEHRELVDLEDRLELLAARRMDALAQLAALRGTTLEDVCHQLGIGSHARG